MLGRVRQQLRDHEVHRSRDFRRDSRIDRRVDRRRVTGSGAARRDGHERGGQSAVLQQGRRDTTREGAQLVQRGLGVDLRLAGELGRGIRVARCGAALESGEVELQSHETLLWSVVDVALQAPQSCALGLHGRAAGGGLGARLRGEVVTGQRPSRPARDGWWSRASPLIAQGRVMAKMTPATRYSTTSTAQLDQPPKSHGIAAATY